MDSRGHLNCGESFRVSGRGGNVGDQSGLTGKRSKTLTEHLSDFVFAMRQMSLAVEQGHQHIAQTRKSHAVGRLAASCGPDGLLTASKIQQMKAGSPSSYSRTTVVAAGPVGCPIDAVLVDVQGVQQMRETGIGRRRLGASRKGRVQIESRFLGRRSPQFALVLQLCAQQRVVTQVNARRLFRFCSELIIG